MTRLLFVNTYKHFQGMQATMGGKIQEKNIFRRIWTYSGYMRLLRNYILTGLCRIVIIIWYLINVLKINYPLNNLEQTLVQYVIC